MAEKLDIGKLTTETLKTTILKVLNTPPYGEKMKIRSALFRDQPEKPLDRAIWWTEWVLRQPNIDHLKSPALQLGFFRTYLIDIVLFWSFSAIISIYLIIKLTKRIIKAKKCDKNVKTD